MAWVLRTALALLAVWCAVRLLGLEWDFPLVALVAFTPYVLAVAVLVLAIAVAVRRGREAAVAGLLVVLFALAVLPRAFPSQPANPIPGGVRVDVLTVNVRLGDADAETIVGLVRDGGVDLLSLQELTHEEVDRLRTAGIDKLLPEHELSPTRVGSSGAGLYSRYPLRRLADVPGGASRQVRALAAVPGAGEVEVVVVHAFPPTPPGVARWEASLAGLPAADPGGDLRLLVGDFNATFDQDSFRRLVSTGYVDAAAAFGRGLVSTWPSDRIRPPPVTIDHVLADERIHVEGAAIHDVPSTDHRAVLANLAFPPRRG